MNHDVFLPHFFLLKHWLKIYRYRIATTCYYCCNGPVVDCLQWMNWVGHRHRCQRSTRLRIATICVRCMCDRSDLDAQSNDSNCRCRWAAVCWFDSRDRCRQPMAFQRMASPTMVDHCSDYPMHWTMTIADDLNSAHLNCHCPCSEICPRTLNLCNFVKKEGSNLSNYSSQKRIKQYF